MNGKRAALILILVALLLASLAGSAALAQSSENYRIGWYVISRGGGQVSSADFALNGAAGQSTTGAAPPSSENYVIRQEPPGIRAPEPYRVYLPMILKQ